VAWVALFIALGGVASGLPGHNTVNSRDVRDNQIRGKDIRARAVASSELRDGGVQRADLANSAVGPEQILDGSIGPDQIGPVPAARVDTPQEAGCVTQEIANNSSEVLQFSNELYDAGGIHSDPPAGCSTAQQSRLTAPINGIYAVQAGISWSNSDADIRQLSIVRPVEGAGAEVVAANSAQPSPVGGTSQAVGTQIALGAGDHLELRAGQVGGGTLRLGNSLDTYFAMAWIGPWPG
jgi:hypothetical protein